MTSSTTTNLTSFPNGPETIGSPRKPNGQFARETAINSVTTVLLPNWQFGYRVGMGGRIYAKREDAVRYATWRANYYGE